MNNRVYPDGVQIELSSGYHHVSQGNCLSPGSGRSLNAAIL
jgi:hypothetical protein